MNEDMMAALHPGQTKAEALNQSNHFLEADVCGAGQYLGQYLMLLKLTDSVPDAAWRK
jgi:hypothetical protein